MWVSGGKVGYCRPRTEGAKPRKHKTQHVWGSPCDEGRATILGTWATPLLPSAHGRPHWSIKACLSPQETQTQQITQNQWKEVSPWDEIYVLSSAWEQKVVGFEARRLN